MSQTEKKEQQDPREVRHFKLTNIETREDEPGKPRIVGYAALFDAATTIRSWFGSWEEIIRRGAFKRAIEEKQDVRALVDHNPTLILGRTKAGTLTLQEDEKGLRIDIFPIPDTTVGRDAQENLRLGNIDQMSFAFIVKRELWSEGEEDKLDTREILDVDLYDVSIVTYPAYPQTEVGLRTDKAAFDRWQAEKAKPGDRRTYQHSLELKRLELAEIEI